MLQAFAFVRLGGGTKAIPGQLFKCIHHGEKTRNWRKLEEKVVYDDFGQIVAQRKKEPTSVRQTGCPWSVRVSYKGVHRGSTEKAWILTVLSLNHEGHDLTENPLAVYPLLLQQIDEWRRIKALQLPTVLQSFLTLPLVECLNLRNSVSL